MKVAVYPRLGELLRERDLTVADLERRIEAQFGLTPNLKTLYRLASGDRIQRADLEIAGAAAAVLGVGLGDLFSLRTFDDAQLAAPIDLSADESRRLSELFALKLRRELTRDEIEEMDRLVSAYGQCMHERDVREFARRHNISVDAARQAMEQELMAAESWWESVRSDRDRWESLRRRARAFSPHDAV